MDTIPNEILCDILSRCSEYTPVLKETCYEWNDILSNTNIALSFEQMTERGHIGLLKYIGKDRIYKKKYLIFYATPQKEDT